jgi:hypothetical protein
MILSDLSINHPLHWQYVWRNLLTGSGTRQKIDKNEKKMSYSKLKIIFLLYSKAGNIYRHGASFPF